jgi:hypothetical protein
MPIVYREKCHRINYDGRRLALLHLLIKWVLYGTFSFVRAAPSALVVSEKSEKYSAVAQLVERSPVKGLVVGSSPTRGANLTSCFGHARMLSRVFWYNKKVERKDYARRNEGSDAPILR